MKVGEVGVPMCTTTSPNFSLQDLLVQKMKKRILDGAKRTRAFINIFIKISSREIIFLNELMVGFFSTFSFYQYLLALQVRLPFELDFFMTHHEFSITLYLHQTLCFDKFQRFLELSVAFLISRFFSKNY